MEVTRIGLDIAKNVFQVHGVDKHGKTVIRKQLKRAELMPFFAQTPPCLIGIEACAELKGPELKGPGPHSLPEPN